MFVKELANEGEQRSVTHLKRDERPVKSVFSDIRSKRAAIQIPGKNAVEFHLKLLSENVMLLRFWNIESKEFQKRF